MNRALHARQGGRANATSSYPRQLFRRWQIGALAPATLCGMRIRLSSRSVVSLAVTVALSLGVVAMSGSPASAGVSVRAFIIATASGQCGSFPAPSVVGNPGDSFKVVNSNCGTATVTTSGVTGAHDSERPLDGHLHARIDSGIGLPQVRQPTRSVTIGITITATPVESRALQNPRRRSSKSADPRQGAATTSPMAPGTLRAIRWRLGSLVGEVDERWPRWLRLHT